jgi:hypothetical protein
MVASFDRCVRLLNRIYFGLKAYHEHGLATEFNKAFDARDDLIRELEDFMPLRMDVSMYTPRQKMRRHPANWRTPNNTRKRSRSARDSIRA